MTPHQQADAIRKGVIAYLRARYTGDLSWHPLFQAARDLFLLLTDPARS